MQYLENAKDLARNPLGIIALFISLIYGLAVLLLSVAADRLTEPERWPIIIFIVVFPVLVLAAFYKLVTLHHGKLYAPGDFKEDNSFLRTLSDEEREEKLEEEIAESISSKARMKVSSEGRASIPVRDAAYRQLRQEIPKIEESVISMLAKEMKVSAEKDVGIAHTRVKFDAFFGLIAKKLTFVEVKVLQSPHSALVMADRVLYDAVLSDRFLDSKFKLILVIVYIFDSSELERVERSWRRRVEECPADIDLRFVSRSALPGDR